MYDGKGQSVVGPFEASGGVRFALKHSGKSNFIVQVYGADGDRERSLANEIGDFDGSEVARLRGTFYLTIEADGPWRIEAAASG